MAVDPYRKELFSSVVRRLDPQREAALQGDNLPLDNAPAWINQAGAKRELMSTDEKMQAVRIHKQGNPDVLGAWIGTHPTAGKTAWYANSAPPTLSLPSGTIIAVLGQGTWGLGENQAKRKAEIAALRLGLDLGMTLIDTTVVTNKESIP